MPYITHDRRVALKPGVAPENAGELNYTFTMLILDSDDLTGIRTDMRRVVQAYIEYKGLKYQYANDVIGALIGAKLEMQRRRAGSFDPLSKYVTDPNKYDAVFDDVLTDFYFNDVGPYEDIKIAENGDLPYTR